MPSAAKQSKIFSGDLPGAVKPPRSMVQLSSPHRSPIMFSVRCPSAPFENETLHNEDDATDLMYSLAEEYGRAVIMVNGQVWSEYTFNHH